LWRHGAAPFDLKKRIVRAVIKEIVVYVEAAVLRVLVHWQGGQHIELNLRKRKAGEHRWKTAESTVALIEQLARVMSDRQIAAQLNRMGSKRRRDTAGREAASEVSARTTRSRTTLQANGRRGAS
jgi:hypothetical protein